MAIASGITLVQGGIGRGKSTLLQLLAGTFTPQSGQLSIGDIYLDLQPDLYRQHVFNVDRYADAFDQMSVTEYVDALHHTYPKFNDALLPDLMEGFGLAPHLHKQLFMLSTGSKHKVFLAGALAAGAPVNILDNPFAGLDHASMDFLVQKLDNVAHSQQQAWIIVCDDLPDNIQLAARIDLGD